MEISLLVLYDFGYSDYSVKIQSWLGIIFFACTYQKRCFCAPSFTYFFFNIIYFQYSGRILKVYLIVVYFLRHLG